MSAGALFLSLAIICSDPALSFRDFYAKFYHRAAPTENWAGSHYEQTTIVQQRLAEAQADWLEYRVARMEKCR